MNPWRGVLRVSPRLILCQDTENLFALRAIGNSMNMANIKGESIGEGDYLIIDTGKSDPADGDLVLSIIDGCANIKNSGMMGIGYFWNQNQQMNFRRFSFIGRRLFDKWSCGTSY